VSPFLTEAPVIARFLTCAPLDRLKKVPDNSGAYKEQISKLSQTIKEVQGKLDKKEAEAASLSSQLASAKKQIQELLASAGKGNQEDVNRRAQLEKALAEAEQQLSKTRAKREMRPQQPFRATQFCLILSPLKTMPRISN
jgi:chromosome segregation ATPase